MSVWTSTVLALGFRKFGRPPHALTLAHALPPLQAAIGPRPAGPDCPPCGGDGFTYEHLADRDEVRQGAHPAWLRH